MNAVVLRTPHASDDTMPRRRLVRAYAKELTYECLRMLRSPAFAIPTLAFPTFFYVLIGFLFGAFKATDPNAQAYVFLGFATMAAMTPGMFSFGVGLATEREQGLHRLKRALPMPTGAAVFAKIALCLLSVMAAVAILALSGLVLGTIQLAPTTLLALAGLLAIGAVPFCALGLMLGAFAGARGAAPLVNVTYMLMLYLSGLFMPLPEAIAKIVVVSPAFYLHQLALHVAHVPNALVGGVPAHVGVLAAMTVLFTTVAVRRFERAD